MLKQWLKDIFLRKARYPFKLFLFLFSITHNVYAQELQINVVAGLPKAPFIIEENGKGLQLDLIREALKFENVSVHFTHGPLARLIMNYQSLGADGISLLPTGYSYPGVFLSMPYIQYQNVAVSLAESNISINTIDELSGKSVAAFQNARKYLGDDFGNIMDFSIDYREVAKQSKQIEMLFLRHTEVIVLDVDIFKDFLKNNQEALFYKEVVIHPIFPVKHFSMGFRDEKIKNQFNKGLQLLKDQGEYQNIKDRYLSY